MRKWMKLEYSPGYAPAPFHFLVWGMTPALNFLYFLCPWPNHLLQNLHLFFNLQIFSRFDLSCVVACRVVHGFNMVRPSRSRHIKPQKNPSHQRVHAWFEQHGAPSFMVGVHVPKQNWLGIIRMSQRCIRRRTEMSHSRHPQIEGQHGSPPPNRISKQSLLLCGNLTWFNSFNICFWFHFCQRKFLHHRLHRLRSKGTFMENVMGEGCGAAYFLILRWPWSTWDSPLGFCLNRFKHAETIQEYAASTCFFEMVSPCCFLGLSWYIKSLYPFFFNETRNFQLTLGGLEPGGSTFCWKPGNPRHNDGLGRQRGAKRFKGKRHMASGGAETKAVGSSKIRFCLNHPWTPNFNQFGGQWLKLHVLAVISTFLMVTSTCWVKSQCLVVSSNHRWRSNQRCIVVGNHFSLEMFIMTLHVPNQPAGRLGDSSQTSQEKPQDVWKHQAPDAPSAGPACPRHSWAAMWNRSVWDKYTDIILSISTNLLVIVANDTDQNKNSKFKFCVIMYIYMYQHQLHSWPVKKLYHLHIVINDQTIKKFEQLNPPEHLNNANQTHGRHIAAESQQQRKPHSLPNVMCTTANPTNQPWAAGPPCDIEVLWCNLPMAKKQTNKWVQMDRTHSSWVRK